MRLALVPPMLPAGGGTSTVVVHVTGQQGEGVADVRIDMSATSGSLETQQVITDRFGYAEVRWAGAQSGTVAGVSGQLSVDAATSVATPTVIPPPSTPPPPVPAPTPDPPPPSTPGAVVPIVALRITPSEVVIRQNTTFHATVTNLAAGDSVIGYQWDWDGNGTVDLTTLNPTRSHEYTTHGVKTPAVTILTALGARATGQGRVVVGMP